MKKTIMATKKACGSPVVSRHCLPHIVEKMKDSVSKEAALITNEDIEISVTDKIEF